MTELSDAIGHVCVGTGIPRRQPEKGRCRNKRDSPYTVPVKACDHGHTLMTHFHQPVASRLDPGSLGKFEGKNLTSSNVPDIVRLGEFGNAQLSAGQLHRGFRPGTA